MDLPITKVTREQLYNDIWSEAVSKACIKYGVSDTAIRKKCKIYNIPIPDNKYRGQLQHGHNPQKVLLPIYTGNNEIEFKCTHAPGKAKLKNETELFCYLLENERKAVKGIYEKIKTEKYLTNPHPLIIKHQNSVADLKKKKVDLIHLFNVNNSILAHNNSTPTIDTSSVSELQLNRAYLILDTLLKALEATGCKIKVEGVHNSSIIIRGESIRFYLREKYIKVPLKEKSKYSWENDYSYEPTGELAFTHSSSSYNNRDIMESENLKLEDKVKSIFKSLFDQSEAIKKDRIDRDERERLWKIECQNKEEKRQIHENEIKKVEELIRDTELYDLANKIRTYVLNRKEAVYSSTDGGVNLIKWCEWALLKADWIDPIVKKDDNLLDSPKQELKGLHNYTSDYS